MRVLVINPDAVAKTNKCNLLHSESGIKHHIQAALRRSRLHRGKPVTEEMSHEGGDAEVILECAISTTIRKCNT